MTEQWMNDSKVRSTVRLDLHELRVARDGILIFCPCGWAYTFSYVPTGEDVSFVYRAHLDDLR